MTATDWLACTNAKLMLEFLRGKVSSRKLRLFACACARQFWDFCDERTKAAIEVRERYEDNEASAEEIEAAQAFVRSNHGERLQALFWLSGQPEGEVEKMRALQAAAQIAYNAVGTIENLSWGELETESEGGYWLAEFAATQAKGGQCDLLRDLFGPSPFLPLAVATDWLKWNDSTIPKIAHAIYAERAFDRMTILADALEDAGCDNADILAHCRGPNEHVRGCWVVDLLLGKR